MLIGMSVRKERQDKIMAFVTSFIQYAVILILLAGIAVLGVFTGKKLRDRKDAKNAAFAADSDGTEE